MKILLVVKYFKAPKRTHFDIGYYCHLIIALMAEFSLKAHYIL